MAVYLNLSNYRLEKIEKKGGIKDVSIGIKLIWIYKALDDDHKRSFWRSFVKEIHIKWSKENKKIEDVIFF